VSELELRPPLILNGDDSAFRRESPAGVRAPRVRLTDEELIAHRLSVLDVGRSPCRHPDHDLRWLQVLAEGLGHRPYLIEALDGDRLVGWLPLAFVKSALFGRFLVSLPYLNSAGVQARDDGAAAALVERAVQLADELDCRFLELRHEHPVEHPQLPARMSAKVQMRLQLPETADALWNALKAKVRNQIRKGQSQGFNVRWGGADLLDEFYDLFCHNMRDLGTPVYGRRLFSAILSRFPREAELCSVRDGERCVAAALLIHGRGLSEVPSASALREYNPRNPNMLMYWHLLQRAIERGQRVFDFGRATVDSGTYNFKKQWGAEASPAVWQYHVRRGACGDMRPDNARHQRLIRIWRRLPVSLTRWIGPPIVRGIP
jgi:FemAB-related protein (PEP-CTERM system-associated)